MQNIQRTSSYKCSVLLTVTNFDLEVKILLNQYLLLWNSQRKQKDIGLNGLWSYKIMLSGNLDVCTVYIETDIGLFLEI